ncbi:Hypothetical_protein [Hexamita inflata]|uniref:Hypothetical_protein n=1 Tax=Hexamita inflata TaxID=28002 RepID=A0AA86Q5D8_9EUKA|nr:Hypothetical protein HINF_LOCUS39103 [Hexamita inflata]
MDNVFFKMQYGNKITGAYDNQLIQYNIETKEVISKSIDFPYINSCANAFPTIMFKGEYYCIPFNDSKLQQQQKVYKMTNSQIIPICDAPCIDTFGYAATQNKFLCFDWQNKQFVSYENETFTVVQNLTDLKISRAHIASYQHHFILVSWDDDQIVIVDEKYQIVQKIKLFLSPFIDYWITALIDGKIILYIHDKNSQGKHVLLDLKELFASELKNSTIFPTKEKYIYKASGRVNQLRRPFIISLNGIQYSFVHGEMMQLDILLKQFEGYLL